MSHLVLLPPYFFFGIVFWLTESKRHPGKFCCHEKHKREDCKHSHPLLIPLQTMPPSTDIASVATSFAPAFDPHEWSTAMSDEDLELFERTRRTHSVFLNGSDKEAKRREIYEYFNRTWELEDKLYEILHNDASFYKYAIPLRHPLIFYLAHSVYLALLLRDVFLNVLLCSVHCAQL